MRQRLLWHDPRLRALLASGLVWVTAAALAPDWLSAAGDRAIDILRRAVLARGEVNYSAVATVVDRESGRGARAFTEIRLCKQGGKQRIKVSDGENRLIVVRVSDGATLWEHYEVRGILVKRTLPSMSERRERDLESLAILARNFSAKLVGTETVAGRPAYRIRIDRPGSPSATVRQFWIDKRTYLELKAERYGEGGGVVDSTALTNVNFSPEYPPGCFDFQRPPNLIPKVVDDTAFRGSLAEAEKHAGFTAIRPKTVPAGFALLVRSVAVSKRGGTPALWLRYTNGIDAFSLFQRRAASASVTPQTRGPVRQWVYKGFQFTLVGHLTPQQVDAIRASYR